MEFDFALEWQNIEYALNESEFITLSEITGERLITSNPNAIKTIGRVGIGVPMLTVNAAARAAGKVAGGVARGTLKTAKLIAKSRFGRADFWGKLIQRLKEIWQRFKNIISSLFKSNEDFIAKELYNAEAVLRNALSNKRIFNQNMNFDNIYPYWKSFNILLSIKINPLNTGNAYMMESLDNKNNFVTANIPALRNIDFDNSNCVEQLKQSLRGSSEPISIGIEEVAKNARSMVDFLRNKDTYLAQLEHEQNTVIRSAEDALRMVSNGQFGGNDDMSASYDRAEADAITKKAMRIRNFISLAQNIIGVKETIFNEYANQSLNLLRIALRKCSAVLSGEVENTKMRHYIDPSQLEDPETRDYGKIPFISKKADRADALVNLNRKREVNIDDKYLETLPDDSAVLQKEIEKATKERDKLKAFINNRKKIGASDSRYIEIKRVIDDYDNRIDALTKKLRTL